MGFGLHADEGFIIRQLYYMDYDYGQWELPWWKTLFLKFNSFLSGVLTQFSQSFVVVLGKKTPRLP
jgi:hypothetical protein